MRPTLWRRALSCATVAGLLVLGAKSAAAQLPSPSTRALGMGDNYTAAATGYAASAWNPALLGLPARPGLSFTILPVRGVTGLSPVSLKDLKRFEGDALPSSVREQWLREIEREGQQRGTGGGDATYAAAQIGRFGLQLSSTLRAAGDVSPGAAELLFFGNAGRTGEPRDVDLSGSEIRMHATSTIAFSYALPLRSSARTSAIGITAKYIIGHFLLLAEDQGSTITNDPALDVRFPVIGTSTEDYDPDGGRGFGLDIGFATRRGALTFGAAVQNLVNTFAWDPSKLNYREGIAKFDDETRSSNFDARPLSAAPAAMRAAVAGATFKPILSAGLAYTASQTLTISSDLRARVGEMRLADAPKLHLGAGAEWRRVALLPVRGGFAILDNGFQIGGGLGLDLRGMSVGVSMLRRETTGGSDTMTMVTLLSTAAH